LRSCGPFARSSSSITSCSGLFLAVRS